VPLVFKERRVTLVTMVRPDLKATSVLPVLRVPLVIWVKQDKLGQQVSKVIGVIPAFKVLLVLQESTATMELQAAKVLPELKVL